MNWVLVGDEAGCRCAGCGRRLVAGDVALAITQGSRVFTSVYLHRDCVAAVLAVAPGASDDLDARAAALVDVEAILCGCG